MNWPVIILLFFVGSLLLSIGVTLIKIWWSRKVGKEVKSTRKDSSYQRPF